MYNKMKSRVHIPPNQEPLEIVEEEEDDEEKRTIFCANIDPRATEEIIYETFLQAGPIESVRIPKDNGGRQKTFGFITYVHKCSVPFALQLLSGLSLYNKSLTIKTKNVQSMPNDCEPLLRGRGGGGGARGNFAMRGNNFSPYSDDNPFKRDNKSPAKRVEWSTHRRNDEMKKHSSNNSRPHHNSPYSRGDPSRDHGGGGSQNRNNNNRRSEQRNRRR